MHWGSTQSALHIYTSLFQCTNTERSQSPQRSTAGMTNVSICLQSPNSMMSLQALYSRAYGFCRKIAKGSRSTWTVMGSSQCRHRRKISQRAVPPACRQVPAAAAALMTVLPPPSLPKLAHAQHHRHCNEQRRTHRLHIRNTFHCATHICLA